MLGFVESIAIAKVFAQRNRYTISPNRELVALGVSTVAAGLSQSYPVSGSFSRTAVNAASGARTQMAGVISAAVVALTLVVLTPFFRPLPNAVLASVVIMAVAGLVDVREARRLWDVKRSDFWLLTVAFAGTLLLGVELGLGVSIVGLAGGGAAPDDPPPHRRARPDPGHDQVPQRRALTGGRGRPTASSSCGSTLPCTSPTSTISGRSWPRWRRTRTAAYGSWCWTSAA